ncbi:conserved hypothetical protein [Anaeromyxobacter dehalogenans 2CP-1]|uniref:Uncharacterized protein n=1 Tax=Anaeromyxobacter dehalogenans (strain ATCC BAA-258 / DSM 21875 / 2CP-1) TaxID=455488 RepID=B8JFH8_ANAD2|nr:hypothetical protein [Anaeromyxobacter dehalogenans]ACL66355.1 conserved hypothetical protein [Anaeromyxobacter dehalogenans 2CP-1]
MKASTARKVNGGADVRRNPIAAVQGRIDALESEARGRLLRALGAGNDALHDLDLALERLSREDWSARGVRRHMDVLRARAENLRASAMRRVADMPGEAVSRLATGSRGPVQNLARGLERIAKRLEERAPAISVVVDREERDPPEVPAEHLE